MSRGGADRAQEALWILTRVFITPASNPKLALALYATIAVVLLIILVVGILIMTSKPEEKRAVTRSVEREGVAKRELRGHSVSPMARAALSVSSVVLVAVAWFVAGAATSSTQTCKSCHWPAAAHARAGSRGNPHMGVDCVACHEPHGRLGRYLTDVPQRLLHLAVESSGSSVQADYGQVSVRACTTCHAASVSDTKTNRDRGLRISHSEPLAAGATCIDCHTMQVGVVGVHSAGMAPCLRCHDSRKASSECSTCHEGSAGAATRARTTVFRGPRIRDVSCGGCHDEKQDCDPCHGTRMPHSADFRGHGHARAAAVDLWYNDGKACGRCHTAYRNPCTACHTTMMGEAHGVWMADGHKTASTQACNTCHLEYAYSAERDFCRDVCHSAAATEASPR